MEKIVKNLIVVIAFYLVQPMLSQNVEPASIRTTEISNTWKDRAKVISNKELQNDKNILWYAEPANEWEKALPLGNGQLGAMVFGGVQDERIQLNESTLWDGYAQDANNPKALSVLREVQGLLFQDQNERAVALAEKNMLGIPAGVKSYQSLGELWLDTPHDQVNGYVRSLDMENAIVHTDYSYKNTKFNREAFISSVDKVMVIRFTADKKEKINLSFTLKRAQDAQIQVDPIDSNSLILKGQIRLNTKMDTIEGLSFSAQVKVISQDGKVSQKNGTIKVENSSELMILVAGATNYPGLAHAHTGILKPKDYPLHACKDIIEKASDKSYEQLKSDHIKFYKKFFDRVEINLGTDRIMGSKSTALRLDDAKIDGKPDLRLIENYFQFGRYLLISSSQPGTMPANLQGLWAWQMHAPWNADYHTNINFQMNYWPTEITNLSELHQPYFDLLSSLIVPGERTANTMYGARGWVVHHLTDAWGFTVPADGPQGIWPMGAAWAVRQAWDYYAYTGDKIFLKNTAYPLMKGASRFIMDFLVEAPNGTACPGKLVTNPSYSPENTFIKPDGSTSVFTYGATMDLQIIHELLTTTKEAADILNMDELFQKECLKTLKQLAPIRISKTTGRIMEWAEDYEEVEPHHRHTSHLFGLYPSNQITILETPDLARAAKKTLEGRGDGGTGWSLAWKINMWNRLHDGEHAYLLLSNLLKDKTLPNLFDNHPPFQIDGNFGATAAIAEMFVQSQSRDKNGNYIIELLPSLPKEFIRGHVSGLLARGGFEVSISWNNKKIREVRIKSNKGGVLNIKYNGLSFKGKMTQGTTIKLNGDLNRI
ncbi:glycoside hydrolase family 95 protein [Galbibacter pacificus]|uniref:Glycoside hydrolase family 95 protein n=1 Tax=Galbibacter pacificus TaxID=2996052 RepID=A0ABT6FMR2_9FLAO|nr:glycoside hydrolase family 95 protein [Galbibacter pacificus]MDG3581070.1 glycoside hydrolase family 95 protein [Galbibacter pacificus]MDG3584548.1 glycoside hydrolase family 95 protein [Galbibacter pacificus]